jgi:hypothetical protein
MPRMSRAPHANPVISRQEIYTLASAPRPRSLAHSSYKLRGKLSDKETIQLPHYAGHVVVILPW